MQEKHPQLHYAAQSGSSAKENNDAGFAFGQTDLTTQKLLL